MSKIEAINDLIRLAEAWNTFDEFKPDWTNPGQYKWHPMFVFNDGKFEFSLASFVRWMLDPHVSSFTLRQKRAAVWKQFTRHLEWHWQQINKRG